MNGFGSQIFFAWAYLAGRVAAITVCVTGICAQEQAKAQVIFNVTN